MDKQKLLQMIAQYTAYKELVVQSYYYNAMHPSKEAQKQHHALVRGVDERWQRLVNYIYAEEQEEE